MTAKRIISCDIDGILNYYPECWLDYLAQRCGTRYTTVHEAKNYEPLYKEYKADYRRSDFKGNLPVRTEGADLLHALVDRGYSIIFATSRPINNPLYPDLYNLTRGWLLKNNLPFEVLLFKDSSVEFIDLYPDIEFHIEVEMKYAQAVAEKGIPVYLYSKHLKTGEYATSGITLVDNLLTILDYVG
ncbi:HAD family hydrolase [Millionella massiliensis]|uniref:hypothetical protein n=1 Tax=Millionella massiliensis TaxID=1871023 RepID=UPI0008DA66D6|nr:hypothetical protein [Millionella massiliensis]